MAKNQTLKDALKTLNLKIEEQTKKIGEEYCKDIVKDVAEKFSELAKTKLNERATPKDSISVGKVSSIISGITVENTKTRSTVRIPNDKEGITMFLEYGTGFYGKYNRNPDAKNVGWEYALNEYKYKRRQNGIKGWYFDRLNTYLDEKDEIETELKVRSWVNPYVRNNKPVKGYYRKKAGYTKVFSAGLVPTRFVYDSKEQIRNAIAKARQSEGNQVEVLREYLKELY